MACIKIGIKIGFKILILVMISINSFGQQPATIPAFSFYKADKTAFTNKQLAENKMIMFVFFDTDCDHCQHAIQYISQHNNDFKKAAVYLITLDGPVKVTPFLSKHGKELKGQKNITLLYDMQSEFLRKFKPRKYPSLFLYSSNKQLVMYDDDEQKLAGFSKAINAAVK